MERIHSTPTPMTKWLSLEKSTSFFKVKFKQLFIKEKISNNPYYEGWDYITYPADFRTEIVPEDRYLISTRGRVLDTYTGNVCEPMKTKPEVLLKHENIKFKLNIPCTLANTFGLEYNDTKRTNKFINIVNPKKIKGVTLKCSNIPKEVNKDQKVGRMRKSSIRMTGESEYIDKGLNRLALVYKDNYVLTIDKHMGKELGFTSEFLSQHLLSNKQNENRYYWKLTIGNFIFDKTLDQLISESDVDKLYIGTNKNNKSFIVNKDDMKSLEISFSNLNQVVKGKRKMCLNCTWRKLNEKDLLIINTLPVLDYSNYNIYIKK